MRRKIQALAFAGILILLLLITAFFAPFLPIAGGFVAAKRIEKYACAVYDVENVNWYAKYNPVSPAYDMTIQRTSGEKIRIACDKKGNIFDEERRKKILDGIGAEEKFERQNWQDQRQFGYVTCSWKFDAPENPLITLCVGIRECSAPFPATSEAMLEKMAERFKIYYDKLTEDGKEALSQAYISYQHYAKRREDLQEHDQYVYSITLDLTDDGGSVTDKIFTSKVAKEK